MLCNRCIKTIHEWFMQADYSPDEPIKHHATAESLQKAAQGGCYICSRFWGRFANSQQQILLRLDTVATAQRLEETDSDGLPGVSYFLMPRIRNVLVIDSDPDHILPKGFRWLLPLLDKLPVPFDAKAMTLDVSVGLRGFYDAELGKSLKGHEKYLMANFNFQPVKLGKDPISRAFKSCSQNLSTSDGPITGLRQRVVLPADNTGSDKVWSMAMKWFSDCVTKHRKCRHTHRPRTWMPTRLLDVGLKDESQVRLVISSAERGARQGLYATLSHCWGKAKFLCLTENSLPSLLEGISTSSLPKTFREAITVTRRLGLRYLWIDSLCIIQGLEEDWQKESSLMDQVYTYSHCNIAATGAHDSSEGLFFDRDNERSCEVDIRTNGRSWTYNIRYDQFWDDLVNKAPLNKRAWVLQERFLAPRILHFGRKRIAWECHELEAAEQYLGGLPSNVLKHRLYSLSFKETWPGDDARFFAWQSILDYYTAWNEKIVGPYTACSLTKAEDKLVALSGLAKLWRSRLRDDYVAGLWKRVLIPQLLWCTETYDVHGVRTRPEEYRAPSFSWASIEGPIRQREIDRWLLKYPVVTILEVKISTVTEDVTGRVTSGFIRMRGHLNKMVLRKRNATVDHDYYTLETTEELDSNSDSGPEYPWILLMDIDTLPQPSVVFFMLLAAKDKAAKGLDIGVLGEGLVLEHIEQVENRKGVFRRLGIFVCGDGFNTVPGVHLREFQAIRDNERYLPCEFYNEATHEHTICLI